MNLKGDGCGLFVVSYNSLRAEEKHGRSLSGYVAKAEV
jgi:hypothetical protein